jgi:CRISPR-associated protein Cmr6
MPKGIIKLTKTGKGKIIVALDRLNGKPPMPLSYVTFSDMTYNENECDFGFEKGMVTNILVNSVQIYPLTPLKTTANVVNPSTSGQNTRLSNLKPDSFKIQETRLPKDVRAIQMTDIDNFNLKFNKVPRYIADKEKFYFFKNDFRKFQDGRTYGDTFLIQPNYGHLDFKQIVKRFEGQMAHLEHTRIEMSPDWRLITGIGGASVYETGMTLHHLYGFPYLPASSIKGLVRSWVIQNCFGTEEESEAIAFKESKLMCDLFGCAEKLKGISSYYKIRDKTYGYAEKQGAVCFCDGLPMSPPQVEADIMNPHYPDWYKQKDFTPPTDFQMPIPIHFLTVAKNDLQGIPLKFVTFLSIKNNRTLKSAFEEEGEQDYFSKMIVNGSLKKESTLLDFVKIWLQKALTEHGIGAKTAVGYGYMK